MVESSGPPSFGFADLLAPLSVVQVAPDAAAVEADMLPISEAEFAEAMAALGPFEQKPALAVAVSGGADSLALCLLASRWAQAKDGSLTALTVDHRLRSGSTSEAEQVGDWMKALAIDHQILPWCGAKPKTGLQDHARRARYGLLTRWCRDAGVLHLLLGHHRRDQAETVAIRISRGSGEGGLAAMAGVVEMPAVRLLRPLLESPPARLRAFLLARNQPWLEDPSNRDLRFSRTAVRNALTAQATTEAALSRLAARMARKRMARDLAAARVVAGCVFLHPAGFAILDPAGLASAPRSIGLTALRNVVGCIGGGDYAPSPGRIERLFASLIIRREAAGGNLGGCRVLWMDRHILVCREVRNLPAPRVAQPDEVLTWDERFLIRFTSSPCDMGVSRRLGPLGREGLQQVTARCPRIHHHPVPEPARAVLPALTDEAGIFSVPHLGFRRESSAASGLDFADIEFRPANPLAGAGCFLAYAGRHIM